MEDSVVPWTHTELKSSVESHHVVTHNARALGRKCRDYYHGDQWASDDLKILQDRKQAPIVNNLIERAVNFLMGLEQSRRTDPKAYPQSPNHEDAAEIATDILRTEAERLDFDRLKSRVFRDLLIDHAAGVLCGVKPSRDDQRYDNVMDRIEPEDLVYDPLSRELDFSDASWVGIGRFHDLDQALADYAYLGPEAAATLKQAANLGTGELAPTQTRTQEQLKWYDPDQDRVFISQIYYRLGGEWVEATLTSTGFLSHQWSPYLDEFGKTRCPIIARSLYIDRRGDRHGRVKSMISPQDEINQRLSRMLWLLSTKQVFVDKTIFGENIDEVRQEMADPQGVIGTNGKPDDSIRVVQHHQDIQHHAILLEQAKQFINLQGPNAALQGRGVENQSGRAIQAQQQSGLMEESEPFDVLRDWALDCYRALWTNCRQFWTEERAVRVTEREDVVKFIMVNQPVIDPQTGMVQMNAPIAQMHVDIRIGVGPDSVTLKAEQREQLVQVLQIYGPQAIPAKVALEFFELNTETRKKIEDAVTGGDDPQAQQMRQMQQQMQQMMAQLEVQAKQLANVKTEAEIRKLAADAAETEAEITGTHGSQFLDAAKFRHQANSRAVAA